MAQRYWEVYAKPIRDQLVANIQARAQADAVTVGEVMAGLGRSRHAYQNSGIYVLVPGMRPLGGNENTPTNANETELQFPVIVRVQDMQEGDYLEDLGALVGVVVDAVEGNPYFPVTAASGEVATAEQVYILEVERPQIAEAAGDIQGDAVQVVTVAVKLCRSA